MKAAGEGGATGRKSGAWGVVNPSRDGQATETKVAVGNDATLFPSVQRQTRPTKLGELVFQVFRGKQHHPCFDYFETSTMPIVGSSEKKTDERTKKQISKPQPATDEKQRRGKKRAKPMMYPGRGNR